MKRVLGLVFVAGVALAGCATTGGEPTAAERKAFEDKVMAEAKAEYGDKICKFVFNGVPKDVPAEAVMGRVATLDAVPDALGFDCATAYYLQPTQAELVEFVKTGETVETWKELMTLNVLPFRDAAAMRAKYVDVYGKSLQAAGATFMAGEHGKLADGREYGVFSYEAAESLIRKPEYAVGLVVSGKANTRLYSMMQQSRVPLTDQQRKAFVAAALKGAEEYK